MPSAGFKIYKLWYTKPDGSLRRVSTVDLIFIAGRPYAVFEWFPGVPQLPKKWSLIVDRTRLVNKDDRDWIYSGELNEPVEAQLDPLNWRNANPRGQDARRTRR